MLVHGAAPLPLTGECRGGARTPTTALASTRLLQRQAFRFAALQKFDGTRTTTGRSLPLAAIRPSAALSAFLDVSSLNWAVHCDRHFLSGCVSGSDGDVGTAPSDAVRAGGHRGNRTTGGLALRPATPRYERLAVSRPIGLRGSRQAVTDVAGSHTNVGHPQSLGITVWTATAPNVQSQSPKRILYGLHKIAADGQFASYHLGDDSPAPAITHASPPSCAQIGKRRRWGDGSIEAPDTVTASHGGVTRESRCTRVANAG